MSTKLKPGRGISDHEAKIARDVFEAGGSPRAQIDAVKDFRRRVGMSGRIAYTPHTGKRELERAKRRAEKRRPADQGNQE